MKRKSGYGGCYVVFGFGCIFFKTATLYKIANICR